MKFFYLFFTSLTALVFPLAGNLDTVPSHIFEATRDVNPKELHTRLIQSMTADDNEILTPEVELFLLHYLWKGSNWDPSIAAAYRRPISNSLQQNRLYHRYYGGINTLLYNVVEQAARTFGIPKETVLLSQTGAFKESLNFRSDVIEPESEEDLHDLLNFLVHDATAGHEASFLFIVADKLAKNIEEVNDIYASALSFLQQQLQDKDDLIKERVYKRFGVISIQEFKGLSLIYLKSYTDAQLPFLQDEIMFAGHTPTMISLWQATLDDSSIRSQPHMKSSASPTAFDDFLSQDVVQDYIAYSNRTNKNNPFVLTSRAFVRLILGLQEKGLSIKLQDPLYGPLIQRSLERIEYLIGQAREQRKDYFSFILTHELITEEILFLVNMIKPYQPEDFQSAYTESHSLEAIPHPVVRLFASGNGASDAILRGYKEYKQRFDTALSLHAYYETHSYFSQLKSHSINGDNNLFRIRFLDTTAMERSIQTLDAEKFYPDIVFLENHTNISASLTEYQQIDTIAATKTFLSLRPANCPLTLVLDITLDKLHSKEIDRFLLTFSQEINEGRLHVILYRSTHKFDQLGMDKVNGGYIIVYSTDAHLREIFSHLKGQLQGLDYQFLTHLHTFAYLEIHDYNKLHYKNAERVYHKLCALVDDSTSVLKFVPKHDKKLPFFDIRYPLIKAPFDATFQDSLFRYLINEGVKEQVAIIRRAGFGFNETSLGDVGKSSIRISIGTQCPSDVEKIATIFLTLECKLQTYLQSIGKTSRDELNEQELQGLLENL